VGLITLKLELGMNLKKKGKNLMPLKDGRAQFYKITN
jgi:hypothetical protein